MTETRKYNLLDLKEDEIFLILNGLKELDTTIEVQKYLKKRIIKMIENFLGEE